MQLYMRRWGSNLVAAGADAAILSWPIPNKSTLNYLKGEFHLLINTALALTNAVVYGCEAWIIKSETTADFDAVDTLWDKFVPKDGDTIDLDTSVAADTNTMIELARVNVSQIMDQEIGGPERIFKRNKLLTGVNSYNNLLTSTNTYFGNDFFNFDIDQKYKVREDSAVLFGVGSPDMAVVGVDATAIPSTIGNNRDAFFMLKHLEDFLDFAMIEATAFTETGAESPYEDIMGFVIDLLEKVNENTALFTATGWNVWGKGMGGIRTAGRLAHTSLGPDAQA